MRAVDERTQTWREPGGGAMGRARLFYEQGRPDRALDAVRDALAADPEDFAAHLVAAGCLLNLNRAAEAERHAREAVRLDADSSDAHRTLAGALARRGAARRGVRRGANGAATRPRATRTRPRCWR